MDAGGKEGLRQCARMYATTVMMGCQQCAVHIDGSTQYPMSAFVLISKTTPSFPRVTCYPSQF